MAELTDLEAFMSSKLRILNRALIGAFVAAAVAQGITSTGAGAQAGGGIRVRPNQEFGALVNGENGQTSPAVITMSCGGPAGSNRTGHPVSGQSVTVYLARGTTGGNTGTYGDEIGAFFGAPPPSPVPSSAGGPVFFTRYETKYIPTSEVLPCSGSGRVYFVPLPMSPGTEKIVVVPVTYLNIAVTP